LRVILGMGVGFLCLFGLLGCVSGGAGVLQRDSFQYPAILSGRLAIGGVIARGEPLEQEHRTKLAELLRSQLLEERHDYPVTPVEEVFSRLGPLKYQQMLSDYETKGILSRDWMTVIKSSLGNQRYLSFAQIENNQVTLDRNETASTDEHGEIVPGSERVITTSKRTLTATLNIYDLEAGELVWSGAFTRSLENQKSYAKDLAFDFVSALKSGKVSDPESESRKYPYPKAPEVSQVLTKVFQSFAERLPKAD
jgi:hypothetical protein